MNRSALEKTLLDWSVENSGFEARRRYIGLSGIGDCERVIYDRYFMDTLIDERQHLKTLISYELEANLIHRLTQAGVYGLGEEIVLYDGLVQGHTDGTIDKTDLLEIKTVARSEHFPHNNRLPRRVWWQVQAYLKYTGRNFVHVVYLARESGELAVYGVKPSERTQQEIEKKIERLVWAVENKQKPNCTCGRCEAKPAAQYR